MAILLEKGFKNTLLKQLEQRMEAQIYMLITAAEEETAGYLSLPEEVIDRDLNQIGSGSYAFLISEQQGELWRSFSAVDLDDMEYTQQEEGVFVLNQMEKQDMAFYQLSYLTVWESDIDDKQYRFQWVILYEAILFDKLILSFRQTFWQWLAFIFLAMFIIQLWVLRWGLKPLNLIAKDLSNIDSGQSQRLSENYPNELKPLTKNMNVLIASERDQREKYRMTLSNLAHSLKTPLALMKGSIHHEYHQDELKSLLDQQIERMDTIIQYQLRRPSLLQEGYTLSSINMNASVEKIISALQKVYHDKQVSINVISSDDSIRFYGDEGDLMEILGNLLENACKWCQSQVQLTLNCIKTDNKEQLTLKVEDDGPGVSKAVRYNILQRGVRLDETVEGQGLGLSIVKELVEQYQGELHISDSELGGACFHLTFYFKK